MGFFCFCKLDLDGFDIRKQLFSGLFMVKNIAHLCGQNKKDANKCDE